MTEAVAEKDATAASKAEEPSLKLISDAGIYSTDVLPTEQLYELVRRRPGDPNDRFIESVRQSGVHQSVEVAVSEDGKVVDVIDGVRRIKAAKAAGREFVPVVVVQREQLAPTGPGRKRYNAKLGVAARTLTANYHRSPNAALELAALEELLKEAPEDEIARQLGIPKAALRRRLRLTRLNPDLRKAWEKGQITTAVAEAAAKLPGEMQKKLGSIVAIAEKITAEDVRQIRSARAAQVVDLLPTELFSGSTGEQASRQQGAWMTAREAAVQLEHRLREIGPDAAELVQQVDAFLEAFEAAAKARGDRAGA